MNCGEGQREEPAAQRERRARILSEARTLLQSSGYAGVTVKALAAAGAVSVPTLYNLFGSKDGVLLAAMQNQFVQLLASPTGSVKAHRGLHCRGVLAVLETCNGQLRRTPRYGRISLRLLFEVAQARQTGFDMAGSLTARLEQELRGVARRGTLLSWIEPQELASQLSSHYLTTLMKWGLGSQSQASLEANTRHEACLSLAGAVANEDERARLHALARRAQRGLRACPDRDRTKARSSAATR